MAFLNRHTLLTSGRRWTFRSLIGLLSGVTLAIMLVGPLLVLTDSWSMIGIGVIAAEVLVLFGGLAWLGMLAFSDKQQAPPAE